MKKLFRFILFFFLVVFFLSVSPKTALAVAFTRRVYLQNVTSSSMDFRWVTDTGATGVIVKYGTTISYGSQVTADSATHAKITGLSPATKYYYQLVSGTTDLTPAGDTSYYFKTAPSTGSTTPFTWAIWGDSGSGGSVNADDLFNKKPDIFLVAGDVGYPYSSNFANNNTQFYNVYNNANAVTSIMRFSPFFATCGNHETSCPTLVSDQTLPQGGRAAGVDSTFSWDYGNAHFVALNSNASHALSDPQTVWARNDLQSSSQPWKIVFWHHNGWSSGSHSTNAGIVDGFVRMASEAGADLAIYGHSHVFERWNKKSGFYPNLQVYTIGNGGQKSSTSCTTTSPGPGCAAKSSGEAGFLLFEVNGNTMTARYITQSGANPDTITLDSGGGTTPFPSPTSGPTSTPTKTPTPKPTNTPTVKPTNTPTPTFKPGTPTPTPSGKIPGDIDGDGDVDIFDYNFLVTNFGSTNCGNVADIDGNCKVDIFDYNILVTNFGKTSGTPTPTPSGAPCTGACNLDHAICNPDRGSSAFSTNITNQFLPFSTGMQNDHVIYNSSTKEKVRFRILPQLKDIPGADGVDPVKALVLEEFETVNDSWIETSHNWFAQTSDGTVCYFGENVFLPGSPGGGGGGSWEAGKNSAKAGIMMPPNPAVGMTWMIEDAPNDGAVEDAIVISTGQSYTTPAGTFQNVVYIEEDNHRSKKRYAPNVGMIYDDGLVLISY